MSPANTDAEPAPSAANGFEAASQGFGFTNDDALGVLETIRNLNLGEIFPFPDCDGPFNQNDLLNQKLLFLLTVLGHLTDCPQSMFTDKTTVKNKEFNPVEILRKLVSSRGQELIRLEHGAQLSLRGANDLDRKWRDLHRGRFTRLGLEFLAGFCLDKTSDKPKRYGNLPLKILIVDNKPKEIVTYDELLSPYLGLSFWNQSKIFFHAGGPSGERVERPDFEVVAKAIRSGQTESITARKWTDETVVSEGFRLQDVDLILQDQFLGHERLHGTDLAELYFDVAPQALVFLTTGLGADTIAGLDSSRGVDRVLPKEKIAALPWYYYLAFTDLLGSMFWDAWLAIEDETDKFPDRTSLRNLLGTIRRWKREPEILWHGQALAEMVDHGNAHISDLWRLSDEILGARKPDFSPVIPHEGAQAITISERIVTALGIWLHDVGHRGDRYAVDTATIRDAHGSISERLLLTDPAAFALEWLPTDKEREALEEDREAVWLRRNRLPNEWALTPLRRVGLLCRHHQSSAPLMEESVGKLHEELKFASDYSRYVHDANDDSASDPVEQLRSEEVDLDWMASDVRVLKDFWSKGSDPDIFKCGCLLRLLDGLHLNRCRVGSGARLRTHRHYLRERKGWCEDRVDKLNMDLREMVQGSTEYLRAFKERVELEHYLDLLHSQTVHFWRQDMVEASTASYREDDTHKGIVLTYKLRSSECLSKDPKTEEILKSDASCRHCSSEGSTETGADRKCFYCRVMKTTGFEGLQCSLKTLKAEDGEFEFYLWTCNFVEKVLLGELEGQGFDAMKSGRPQIEEFAPLAFEVMTPGGRHTLGSLRAPWKELLNE